MTRVKHGFCTHLGQSYGHAPEDAWWLDQLGGRVRRDDFFWDVIEEHKGKYKVGPDSGDARVDDIYRAMAEHRGRGNEVDLLMVMAYGNPAYVQDITSGEWRAAFAEYVVASVRGLLAFGIAPRRLLPSIWNEPNSTQFGQGFESNPEAYAALCATVRARVKAVHEDIRVVAGEGVDGSWIGNRDWYRRVLAVPYIADVISTHEYH